MRTGCERRGLSWSSLVARGGGRRGVCQLSRRNRKRPLEFLKWIPARLQRRRHRCARSARQDIATQPSLALAAQINSVEFLSRSLAQESAATPQVHQKKSAPSPSGESRRWPTASPMTAPRESWPGVGFRQPASRASRARFSPTLKARSLGSAIRMLQISSRAKSSTARMPQSRFQAVGRAPFRDPGCPREIKGEL